jgi:hypothetical protein
VRRIADQLARSGNWAGALRRTIRCCSPRFARLPYVFCPSGTPLAEHRKRVRRQGPALSVTRPFVRSHDAAADSSFCHALAGLGIGQERRAKATGTLSVIVPHGVPVSALVTDHGNRRAYSQRLATFQPGFPRGICRGGGKSMQNGFLTRRL